MIFSKPLFRGFWYRGKHTLRQVADGSDQRTKLSEGPEGSDHRQKREAEIHRPERLDDVVARIQAGEAFAPAARARAASPPLRRTPEQGFRLRSV